MYSTQIECWSFLAKVKKSLIHLLADFNMLHGLFCWFLYIISLNKSKRRVFLIVDGLISVSKFCSVGDLKISV